MNRHLHLDSGRTRPSFIQFHLGEKFSIDDIPYEFAGMRLHDYILRRRDFYDFIEERFSREEMHQFHLEGRLDRRDASSGSANDQDQAPAPILPLQYSSPDTDEGSGHTPDEIPDARMRSLQFWLQQSVRREVGELRVGMSRDEVLEACGGKEGLLAEISNAWIYMIREAPEIECFPVQAHEKIRFRLFFCMSFLLFRQRISRLPIALKEEIIVACYQGWKLWAPDGFLNYDVYILKAPRRTTVEKWLHDYEWRGLKGIAGCYPSGPRW